MDTILLTPLLTLETSLTTLLTTLTTSSTAHSAPAAAQSLLTADTALTSALALLQQHQENYTRILSLRAEVDDLHNQIRSIVTKCVGLRDEAEEIAPGILEDSDDEQEQDTLEGTKQHEVDYTTLLSFASRIAKESATAERDAEEASQQRRIEARTNSQTQDSGATLNGAGAQDASQASAQHQTLESSSALQRAAENHLFEMHRVGVAFPDAERLRMGVLGRLQRVREEEGEGGVERVVRGVLEREMRERGGVVEEVEEAERKEEVKKEELSRREEERPQVQASTMQTQPVVQQPPRPKKKAVVDLDFPSDDDDED